MNRTIVLGDIHGCFREFMALLEKINYDESSDFLCIAGDLVDRGPDSNTVVRWIREAHTRTNGRVACVMGNHDQKHYKWFKHMQRKHSDPGYHVPMSFGGDKLATYNSMTDEDLEFLGSLPPFIHFELQDWVVVHAGLEPWKALRHQDPGKMCHLRYLNKTNLRPVSLGHDLLPPPNSVYWTEHYNLPHNVVYGHNVHSLKTPRIVKKGNGAQLVGLDTGCVFGGCLTAFFVPDTREEQVTPEHFVSVQAHKTYSQSYKITMH